MIRARLRAHTLRMRLTLRDLSGALVGGLDAHAAPDVLIVHDPLHLRAFRAPLPALSALREYGESPALHLDRLLRLIPPSPPPPTWRRRRPSADELETQSWWWRRAPGRAPVLCFVHPNPFVAALVHDFPQRLGAPPTGAEAAPLSVFASSEWAPAQAP